MSPNPMLSKETLAIVQQIRAKGPEARREQATADILSFIRSHWMLFCATKQEMESAYKGMEQTGIPSVSRLSDLVGLPDIVHFVRTKQESIQRALLDFPKSPLFDKFMICVNMHDSAEAVLFAVSGESTHVITNIQTDYVEGEMHLFYKSSGRASDIHIFSWRQAPKRTFLFRHM